MEGKIRTGLRLVLALTAVIALATAARPDKKKDEQPDNLVRLMKAESLELLEINGQSCRKAIASTFLHNGTYLISDTALWNVDTRVINLWGHVKVIQDETILTSEKLDYYIDSDLAQFRGTLVQLQNKKRNILRTKHLDYNTKDSIAIFRNGAAMRDEDGQLIESINGTYSSREKVFDFQEEVNMFTDSVLVKTRRLMYDSEREKATFPTFIDFWKSGNMLSSSDGWYDRRPGTFFFHGRVHGLSDEQEFWSDSLYYFQPTNDIRMLHGAQVQDTLRNMAAMANRIDYRDSLREVTLQRDAAVVLFTETEDGRDTIYIGADKLKYWQTRYCDIPEGTVKACSTRLSDIMTDAVAEFRIKAAKAAKEAEEARANPGGKDKGKGNAAPAGGTPPGGGLKPGSEGKPGSDGKPASGDKPDTGSRPGPGGKQQLPPPGPETAPLDSAAAAIDRLTAPSHAGSVTVGSQIDSLSAPSDSLKALSDSILARADSIRIADSLATGHDSTAAQLDRPATPLDSIAPASDSIAAPLDSLGAPLDSLGTPADSIAAPLDTTKYGFALALGNVKIFRRDLQARCDSMAWSDLDSIARFYKDPVVWNEVRRQYTSDSLFVLVGGGGARKASLQSNAFIVTQNDEICYDQIKGAEIMAYFDSTTNTLQRFDALGGASALFYLEENDALATVNKVESKMLSGILKEGTVDQVFYFESPKNNAYPVVQLPEDEKRMKGFSWRPDERPTKPSDITPLKLRRSDRREYRKRPKPVFKQAEIYFPGYIPGILREIAVRDSLAKLPKPKKAPVDAGPALDSLLLQADSLAAVADSLILQADSLRPVGDSLIRLDSLAVRDSLKAGADSLKAGTDSLKAGADSLRTHAGSISDKEEVDPLSVPTVDPRQKRKEECEARRKLRQAERDARQAEREKKWAQLDSLDAAKAEARRQKALERERARKIRILKAQRRRELRESAKLLKYIDFYQKQYEREQERELTLKRPPSLERGGELPPPAGTGEEAPRSDAVLGDDGSVDDDPVLGGGSVPGP